jgi:hypothetical protein
MIAGKSETTELEMRSLPRIAISQRRVPVPLHTRRIQAEGLTGPQTLKLSHFHLSCLSIKTPSRISHPCI